MLAYEVATGTACFMMGALTMGALTTAGAPTSPWPQGEARGATKPGAAATTAKRAVKTTYVNIKQFFL